MKDEILIVILVVFLTLVTGVYIGQKNITQSCDNFSAFMFYGTKYECHK